MEVFDLRAFADTAGVFNVKSYKPYVDKWFPWKAPQPKAVLSRFANLASLRDYAADFADFVFAKIQPVVTDVNFARDFENASAKVFYSLFLTRAQAKVAAPVVAVAKPELRIVETLPVHMVETFMTEKVAEQPRKTLTLKAAMPERDLGEAFAQEMKKQAPSIPVSDAAAEAPRKTLTLKTKVDLPVISSLSKASSGVDLAAAFKSEMKVITERKAEAADLHAVFAEKRKHPLSAKSWKELQAEAETLQPQKEIKNIDLGAAFKREMQAVMAAEERMADVKPQAKAPAPKPRKLAA